MKPIRGATMAGANLVNVPAEGFMDEQPNPRLLIERIEGGRLRVQLEHRYTGDEWFIISVVVPAGDMSLKSLQADVFSRFQELFALSYGRTGKLPPLLMPKDGD